MTRKRIAYTQNSIIMKTISIIFLFSGVLFNSSSVSLFAAQIESSSHSFRFLEKNIQKYIKPEEEIAEEKALNTTIIFNEIQKKKINDYNNHLKIFRYSKPEKDITEELEWVDREISTAK